MAHRAKRVRLVDIANRLNLTKVAVSKALRDHPDISAKTRELVKKTAAEMGYTPNLLARSLLSKRTHTLGVVVPKIAHTFFTSVIDSIQSEATKEGYGILLAVSNEDASLERQHIERLLAMHVDGLLVSVSKQQPDLEAYRRVRDMHVPLVFFDREIQDLGFPSVTVDDYEGALNGVRHLIAQGHRRIVHIAGTGDVEIGRRRRAGYEAALREHDIPVSPSMIFEGGFDAPHGYETIVRILHEGEFPDAIFAVTFPVGLGVHAGLCEHAPRLAEKTTILAFGTGEPNEFYTYPNICVRQPTHEMGRRAVQLLLDRIEEKTTGPAQRVVLKTGIVTRDTYRFAATQDT